MSRCEWKKNASFQVWSNISNSKLFKLWNKSSACNIISNTRLLLSKQQSWEQSWRWLQLAQCPFWYCVQCESITVFQRDNFTSLNYWFKQSRVKILSLFCLLQYVHLPEMFVLCDLFEVINVIGLLTQTRFQKRQFSSTRVIKKDSGSQ